jgi:PKD repeat protein
VEPPTNVAPVPTFITSCIALACGTSSAGTVDSNVGDVISYLWNWGDGTPTGTGTAPAHSYLVPGTYTVTLTATDGWLRAGTTTRQVVLVEPATNAPPTVTFTANCTALTCQMNSFGTVDPDGDVIRYSWNFGDLTAASTTASPSHSYTTQGTYTITLTVTDGWNRVGTATRTVTMTEPLTNVAPTAVFTATCTGLTCQLNSAGTTDANGDPLRYSWNFGDLTAVSTAVTPLHLFPAAGTYTITLTVSDGWNRVGTVSHPVTVTVT